MKFKPKKSDWYEIIDFKEEIDKNDRPKNRLGAFICMDSFGNTFSVGSGLTDHLRHAYWSDRSNLVGKFARVEYQHITPGKQIPRFPVFVEVEEFSGEKPENPLF